MLGGFFWWWKINLAAVNPKDKTSLPFIIKKGDSVSEIASNLKKQKLIRNNFCFKLYILVSGFSKKIQAGNYFLSPSMEAREIIALISRGRADKKITIIEGLRGEEIALVFQEGGFSIDPQAWEQTIKSQKLEGRLFPDTYFFKENTAYDQIIKVLKDNFDKKITEGLKKEIAESELGLDEIITLASLVEREAKDEESRRIIAGILIKRWKNDWPLQVDATVQYAVGSERCKETKNNPKNDNEKCRWWPQALTASDLEINSPYNTYKYRGLPPGPICNPGLSAIKAVLNPQPSTYWFYLTDNKGQMHYANTSQEHAANIQKYLK